MGGGGWGGSVGVGVCDGGWVRGSPSNQDTLINRTLFHYTRMCVCFSVTSEVS